MALWTAMLSQPHQQQVSPRSGASGKPDKSPAMLCTFCKKNGEDPAFYHNHKLRDENEQICCPVLKAYKCPHCNVTGRHTASYCPRKQQSETHKQVTPPTTRRPARRSSSQSQSSTSSPRSALRTKNQPAVVDCRRKSHYRKDDTLAAHARLVEIQSLAYTIQAFIIQELYIKPQLERFSLSQ